MYIFRTDLAIESQEGLKKESESIHGVRLVEQKLRNGSMLSTVYVDTENASRYLKRPKGVYVTLEDASMLEREDNEETSREVAKTIRRMLHLNPDLSEAVDRSVLVVGLGNREVTPDSLGPSVINHLFITRHMIKEYGPYVFSDEKVGKISGIAPGVMAQTGMECEEIIEGIVEKIRPDYVLTVDALAARNARRLSRTIQFTNTGITPGSGIGNHRKAIDEKSIGVMVLSIGVPTVVDAATIVFDAMEEHSGNEIRRVDPKLNEMFVTSKNIDEDIRKLSDIISEGINIAFLGNNR